MQNSSVMSWMYRLLDNPTMKSNAEILIVMAAVVLVLSCILAAVVIADKRRQRDAKPARDGDRCGTNGIPCTIRVVEIADGVREKLRNEVSK